MSPHALRASATLIRRTLSVAVMAAFVFLPARASATDRKRSCDNCQTMLPAIEALGQQIDQLYKQRIGPYGKPGEPLKPPKPDPDIDARIKALEAQRDVLTKRHDVCEKASNDPPSLAMKPVTLSDSVAPADAQIAVGRKFVAVLNTSNVIFLDKKTLKPASVSFVPTGSDGSFGVTDLFHSVFKALDQSMHLPANVCDPNDPNFDSKFDPKHPDKVIPGCISEAYDTRVIYDESRHRFWIESAVRHRLFFCPPEGPPFTGLSIGCSTVDPSSGCLIADPGGDSKGQRCHHDWDTKWLHRFVAVAVTRVDKDGNEDLSKPPFVYGLWEDNADWPLMSLHNSYLILSHLDRKAPGPPPVAVFDADRLANPHLGDDGSALKIKPLAEFQGNDFTVQQAGNTFPPDTVLYPVNMHGSMGRVHLLVGFSGDSLLFLGITSPEDNPSGVPKILKGSTVPLGPLHVTPTDNPEYRDGMVYLAFNGCKEADNEHPCALARVLRVPVTLQDDRVLASTDPTLGFLDCDFEGDDASLGKPMMIANKNGDMVVAFERFSMSRRISTGLRFAVWYHDHGRISDGAWVKEGDALNASVTTAPGTDGLDLGSLVLDPEDAQTVWISNAFSDSSGSFHHVIATVKP